MSRIGLMGGTFDPIHNGHLLLAQFIGEQIELDEVLFTPAADPPHKEHRCDIAAAEHRWRMVEFAIAGVPHFRSSRSELDRPGKSYTVDTLGELARDYPDAKLYLIVGSDNAADVENWQNPQEILAQCTVVAGTRRVAGGGLASELADRMMIVDTPIIEISSTDIRKRLREGLPVRGLLPESVEKYIRGRGLYGT